MSKKWVKFGDMEIKEYEFKFSEKYNEICEKVSNIYILIIPNKKKDNYKFTT